MDDVPLVLLRLLSLGNYGALLYGGTLVVVAESARDPQSFLAVLNQQGVTVLNQTPSSFSLLAQHILNSNTRPQLALRYVIFGGEALDPAQLKQWNAAYPAVSLVNMYGITETTVHVTFKALTQESLGSYVSNIGRPIPTTSTYVMDAAQDLLPVGVLGELHVGGAGSRARLSASTGSDCRKAGSVCGPATGPESTGAETWDGIWPTERSSISAASITR